MVVTAGTNGAQPLDTPKDTPVLYAFFGGMAADKRSTYELLLEQRGPDYVLTAVLTPLGGRPAPLAPRRWSWLLQPFGAAATRRLYAGGDLRRALLILLQAGGRANLAELGRRYCYVLPSTPSRGGELAVLLPPQLRYDGSLPAHPQLWQLGRPLDTLPAERHGQIACEAPPALLELAGDGRGAPQPPPARSVR
jgi:hypothetical protein